MTELETSAYFKRVYPFVVVARVAGYFTAIGVFFWIGVWDSGWGKILTSLFAARLFTALAQLRQPAATRLAGGVFDVLIPPVTAFLLGYEPSAMHLLIAGQVAAVFLVLQPRSARVVLAAGVAGMLAGLVVEDYSGIVPLSSEGTVIGEYAAIVMGLSLTVGLVWMVGRTMWDTHRRLSDLAEAERRNSQLKQRFTSMVSHELRTPLTSIRGFADLLRTSRGELEDADIDEFTATIADQADHLSRLVDDILIAMKGDSEALTVNMGPVNVAEVVSSVMASVIIPHHVTITTQIPADLISVADPDRLFQVTRNLVENAVKYGGPNIEISGEGWGGHARIAVSDDGPGIPEDRVEDVFAEFVQLEDHGTGADSGVGLGLSIVRRLVEAMGGCIWYQAGKRPAFVVELPCSSDPATVPLVGSR
jgi:signal transduction histidine kinase